MNIRRMRQRQGMRQRQAGFSLLELLVVLAILALLAGIVGPRVMGYLGRAKSQTASIQIENIKTAMDVFFLDVGRYPTDEEGLNVLAINTGSVPGWAGPYLADGELPVDPWGRPYRYDLRTDGTFAVYSFGADDAEGGTGDNQDVGR